MKDKKLREALKKFGFIEEFYDLGIMNTDLNLNGFERLSEGVSDNQVEIYKLNKRYEDLKSRLDYQYQIIELILDHLGVSIECHSHDYYLGVDDE